MNQEVLSTELDKRICEVIGCNERVATIIQVKVGQQGSIPLFVCERCINKFSHENTNQTKSKRHSNSAVIDIAYDLNTKEKAGTDGGQTHKPAADFGARTDTNDDDIRGSDILQDVYDI